jgi:hypothetical protein
MRLLGWIFVVVLLAGAAAAAWALRASSADERDAGQAWQQLLTTRVPGLPDRYDPALVASLPEPARRFFAFAIQPGARISTVAEITMGGELSLGSKEDPKYMPMQARQVLAAPAGFIWELDAGQGAMRVSGSDGMAGERSWTRFWLLRLLPVARVGGDADHLRSSFGRVVAEAAFWTPAFLLPRPGVEWSQVDADTARATVTHGPWVQSVEIRVDARGQPLWASLPRWTNANPQKAWREQPFGGKLSDFREVAGYRVPFRVDGGNFFGTPDYFPFYKARVQELRFR